MYNMSFEVSKDLINWIKQHLIVCQTKAFDGSQFKYEFTPTETVEVQTVKCLCCGDKKTVYIE